MITMIEKVDRAIEKCGSDYWLATDGEWKAVAKAAIEAMREPSEGMIEAMGEDTTLVWQAGIDAALKEE